MSTKKKAPKQSSAGESKMALATKAYERTVKVEGVKRKEIIEEFINGCSLTPAGAATYYTLIRKNLSKRTNGMKMATLLARLSDILAVSIFSSITIQIRKLFARYRSFTPSTLL